MKRYFFLLAVVVGLASCSAEPASSDTGSSGKAGQPQTGAPANVLTINSGQTKTLLEQEQGIVILDVRTQDEYTSGHLKHAQLIDFYASDFQQRLQSLDPAKTYVVYCAVGGRSREAAQMMGKMGFRQVYDSSEGFSSLKDSGLPVE